MNIYRSRLKRIMEFHPVDISPYTSIFSPVVYNHLIYFVASGSSIDTNHYLCKWNGISNSFSLVATLDYSYSINQLVVHNNELYICGSSGTCYKLASNGSITTVSSTGFSSLASLSNAGRYHYVSYNNKIHAFVGIKTSIGTYPDSDKGLHFSFDGTTWTRESTTGPFFTPEAHPIVWNNKIYIFGFQKNTGSASYPLSGSRIYSWDGSNWAAFYCKTSYNTVDSNDDNTLLHNVYYRLKNGSAANSYTISGDYGELCIFDNEMYIFHYSQNTTEGKKSYLSKYDVTVGDFVVQNDDFPQVENVNQPFGGVYILEYKNAIYAMGGWCTYNYSASAIRSSDNTTIYRYNPSTKEWEV